MNRLKTENVLIFGKKNEKIDGVKQILTEHFNHIFLNSSLSKIGARFPDDHFRVIIVTDSLKYTLNKDLLYGLRTLFPKAKVICLVDQITQKIEMDLRSASLVFLGSYDYFGKHYRDIIVSALKSARFNQLSPSSTGRINVS